MWESVEMWAPVVRDVLSVGLAALGSWLAWLSIKMGREQDAVTARQMAIMESLRDLEAKQAATAEKQHALVSMEMARRPDLAMRVARATGGRNGVAKIVLAIRNNGDRLASNAYWYVMLAESMPFSFEVNLRPGNVEASAE